MEPGPVVVGLQWAVMIALSGIVMQRNELFPGFIHIVYECLKRDFHVDPDPSNW